LTEKLKNKSLSKLVRINPDNHPLLQLFAINSHVFKFPTFLFFNLFLINFHAINGFQKSLKPGRKREKVWHDNTLMEKGKNNNFFCFWQPLNGLGFTILCFFFNLPSNWITILLFSIIIIIFLFSAIYFKTNPTLFLFFFL